MPRLKVVGAGSPTRTGKRWGTCFLLEIGGEWLMIDCGLGSSYKMYQMGVSPTEINHLFFTHLHSDHISDLPCFLMTRFDQSVATEPELQMYGPRPFQDVAERVWSEERGVFWYDVVARVNHPMSVHAFHSRGGVGERPAPVVGIHEYGEGKVGSGKHWECFAREVQHAQPYLNCFGLRFETDEGVIAFSGDTAPVDSVVKLARDADLLVQNVMELESVIRTIPEGETMTGSTGAGKIAAAAGAKRLLANHQAPGRFEELDQEARAIAEVKAEFAGEVFWAQDFTEIEWASSR